jgi:hypothetical protein
MKTITKTVYNFDELKGAAKERARQWLYECATDLDWYDCIYEDVIQIGQLMGLEINPRYHGEDNRPDLWFSLSYSQSDGTCWGGTIDANKFKGAYRRVKAHAPVDSTLHRIARDCEDMYQAMRQYQKANKLDWDDIREYTVKSNDRYYSSRVEEGDVQIAAGLDAIARRFNRWVYGSLQEEFKAITSEENLSEMANSEAYTFDAYGNYEG